MCLAPCSIVPGVLRTRSYRTLRDGSCGWRFSRHFVPGYDRTVPPGQFATGLARWLDAVAKCLPARPGGTTPIVAWHEVPGKASLERTVPSVRYDRTQRIPEVFLVDMCA